MSYLHLYDPEHPLQDKYRRFPYINLYHDNDEFMSLVDQLSKSELQISSEKGNEMKGFAEKNTWESRYEEVKKILFNV